MKKKLPYLRIMLSQTEENYLKCIYKLSGSANATVSTNDISAQMQTTAASVTDMLKRLSEKELVNYAKYKGVNLSEEGRILANGLIRRHRLWEVFLVEKLKFSWDEVHEIAEQLEHINSDLLIQRLDEFLSFPKFDPHGDPIPDRHGKYFKRKEQSLSTLKKGESAVIVGVKDHSTTFLQYLASQKLTLGVALTVQEIIEYDKSLLITVSGKKKLAVSSQVAENILVGNNEKPNS
ncbi:MAG: metal-dependent transcriptional regulator [Bacteroidetes bacterium]|nr:metal-dependent transcriptional regulator [Bacteroidota bacterium]